MPAPKEHEIRAFAKKICALDENGNYTEPRNKLAAGAVEYRRELEAEQNDGVDVTPTVDRIVEFAHELAGSLRLDVDGDGGMSALSQIVASVAGALVQRDGLHLRNEGIPHE